MLKIWFNLFLIVLSVSFCQAQDLIFSQFHAVPAQINPALVGTTEAPKFVVGYRNRAPAWPNAFVSSVAYYDQYVDRINSGIGIGVFHDRHGEGVWQVNGISAFYTYNAAIKRTMGFRIGIEGGIRQEVLDYDQLIFFDQLHPETGAVWPNGQRVSSAEVPPTGNNIVNADISAGISFYHSRFYAGFSAKHLSTPDFNFLQRNDLVDYGIDIRLSAQLGIDIPLETAYGGKVESFISPYFLWVKQGGAGQFNGGVFGGGEKFYGGVWYRYAESNSDALIAMIGMRAGMFKIGYSYDYILSELSNELTGGAHEITVTLNFSENEKIRQRIKEKRFNDCFRLFR